MINFDSSEVPVAFCMINAAQQHSPHPVHAYMCYWIAFNNIYTTITDRALAQQDRRVKLKTRPDGTIKTKTVANVNVPDVDNRSSKSEQKQIEYALQKFSVRLIHDLIIHPSTQFFVNRIPNGTVSPLKCMLDKG